jgi:cytochrome c oxidase cbb3-type subunit III
MSKRAIALAVAAALPLLTTSCEREARDYRPKPALAALTRAITMSDIRPGGGPPPPRIDNPYEQNAFAVSEGKRLFRWYNCNGCHANGGGGMGPPLMDQDWIYGSSPGNVVATVLEGRPNGMPSFRGKIPDNQAWQIAAYVRSMSGLLAKDVSPSRSDHMNAKPPESSTERMPPRDVGVPLPPSSPQ